MALRGTLIDIGIVDLVQLPNRGRKTGELIVVGTNDEARLYYEDGSLIHALMGNTEGLEVLVDVLDWEDGEFEFRLDIDADDKTIDMDLHRAVMQALKIRDDRKEEEARIKRLEEEALARGNTAFDPKYTPILTEYTSSTPFAEYICVLNTDGEVIAESSKEEAIDKDVISELQEKFYTFLSDYPRKGFDRLILTDANGVIVVSYLDSKEIVIVFSTQDTAMGAISRSVQKLVSTM